MDDSEQPRPLHIVKKQTSLDAADHPPVDSQSGGRLSHRTSSVLSEQSMESISEEPNGIERPLSIPKKRRFPLARRGIGAERFDTPAVAAASARTRRRMNATDNFGCDVSDEEVDGETNADDADLAALAESLGRSRTSMDDRRGISGHSGTAGPRHRAAEAGISYGSIRSRIQTDAGANAGYDMDAPPQRPRSTIGDLRGQHFEGNRAGSMRLPRRTREERSGTSFDYRSVYDMGSEPSYRGSVPRYDDTDIPPAWDPNTAEPPLRRPSVSSYVSRISQDRFPEVPRHMQDQPNNRSPLLRHKSYERPVSVAGLPGDTSLFSPDPYERAATAIPFDGRHPYQRPQNQPYADYEPELPTTYSHFDRFGQPAPFDLFDRRHPSRPSLPLAPPGPLPEADPQILVPIVSVTPERRTVVGDVNSFWAAIELFAQVTAPMDTIASRSRTLADGVRHASTTSASPRDDQAFKDLYRYGYLSDMNIEIHPSPHSEILEVIGKSPSILTLFPGSRRLMVVHVHLNVTPGRSGQAPTGFRPLSHREKSEKLMEDLELQLGATAREYMQVQLTYNHSGFPKFGIGRNLSGRSGGCVAVQTTIETTATAVILQQNTSSVWSPSPSPANSPLVDIVGKHWGPAAALEMAQRLAASNEMRLLRKSANPLGTWIPPTNRTGDTEGQDDEGTQPTTPKILSETKGQGDVTPRAAAQNTHQSGPSPEHARQVRPEEKQEVGPKQQQQQLQEDKQKTEIEGKQSLPGRMAASVRSRTAAGVADIRRVSSSTGRRASSFLQEAPVLQIQRIPSSQVSEMPANVTLDVDHPPPPGCLPMRNKTTGLRQTIPDTAPRIIKRPVGTDTTNLRLSHHMSDLTLGGENKGERERLASYIGTRNSSRGSMASKKSGKWSWTGWFA